MKLKLITAAITLVLATSACSDVKTETNNQVSAESSQANAKNLDQAQLNTLGETLDIKYRLVTNYPQGCPTSGVDGRCFTAQIDLTSAVDLDSQDWSIYFSQMRPVQSVSSGEFTITRVKGDLHKIAPTTEFKGLKKGVTKTLEFKGELWQLSETDAMPNYYLVSGELDPVLIRSTAVTLDSETGMELRPYAVSFTDEETQYKRSDTDKVKWATPEILFQANQGIDFQPELVTNTIIPTPLNVNVSSTDRPVSLKGGIKLELHEVKRSAIDAAVARLSRIGVNESSSGLVVSFLPLKVKSTLGSYLLDITKNKITISAADDAGFSYGLSSLTSLLDSNDLVVNTMRVEDSPRYDFRGMHIDVSRNFHSKQLVLDMLDQMAAYKLNKLHLHMADDEGWRLEIEGLPELTDIGSKRCHDLSETRCLLPQLGSGPFADAKVNGYYSKADYIEILKYAGARQIQVIPSMDMPGHSRAAIKSMEARYRKLAATGDIKGADEYRLIDPKDTTVYSSIQYYDDNTLNVCMESTFHFVDKVIDEIATLHEQAGQPLSVYHIGADETAGAWLDSPMCKAFLADNKQGVSTSDEFGAYFVERVSNILHEKGIEPAGWSDGMSHTRPKNMPKTSQTNVWDVISHNGFRRAHQQANLGWDAILGMPEMLYFDFPYEADPKEHGYYWASRNTNERKLYGFMPDNLPANAEQWTDIQGKPFEADDTEKRDKAGKLVSGPMKEGVSFSGLQGQIWSETLRSDAVVEYMTFPRLLILAEKAWHKASWEVPYQYKGAVYNQTSGYFSQEMRNEQASQWAVLANTLGQKELVKLDKAGIEYRVPTVGAHIHEGQLLTNLIYPGLTIEYRVNGGEWLVYHSPVAVDGQVEVRAIAANGKRKGRALIVR
ncbi:carbohydate-binding domain-containing protein [Shewanella eurypsychrophilus]|uniref:beta-N-acetylhexosaminidase n=1 Tax=Shewanella eurypsychrophilus TaxID=2593656 RepID=A0ABX6V378_9GAMM|nr:MULTISPECIES: family 20 glycosylhydrolase [Shewanella]QFU21797.1 family 20 glycosylhydrolase [Shewanella sp. YLB-09]QPG57087.1 carbohydate-binding domain-containing protein [Shewanella eurypsychrophilus]